MRKANTQMSHHLSSRLISSQSPRASLRLPEPAGPTLSTSVSPVAPHGCPRFAGALGCARLPAVIEIHQERTVKCGSSE